MHEQDHKATSSERYDQTVIERAAVQRVRADRLQAKYSAIAVSQGSRSHHNLSMTGASLSANTEIRNSASVVAGGGSVRIANSASQWVVGGSIDAQNVFAVGVIGGSIEGNIKCLMNTRAAIAFGIALGLSTALASVIKKFAK